MQITGSAGIVATLISGLGSLGTAGIFTLLGSANQLIFDGGRVRAGISFAEAQKDEAVAPIWHDRQGVREVSGARRLSLQIKRCDQQALRRGAIGDSVRLANLRYRAGVTSYLEVLNAQTQSYDAQINLALPGIAGAMA